MNYEIMITLMLKMTYTSFVRWYLKNMLFFLNIINIQWKKYKSDFYLLLYEVPNLILLSCFLLSFQCAGKSGRNIHVPQFNFTGNSLDHPSECRYVLDY